MECDYCKMDGFKAWMYGIPLRLIYPKKGKSFLLCDNCLVCHGLEYDYDVPSPFHDLLIELGMAI